MSLLFAVGAALAWFGAVACAHDAVSGDSAGGGLARSLLIPCVLVLLLCVLALAWSRGRAGAPLAWSTLFAALAVATVGAAAALAIILAAPLVTTWALVAQLALAGQGLLLMVLAWRGTASVRPASAMGLALGLCTLAPLLVLLPTRSARAAALEARRADRAADEAAASRR